MNKLDEKTRQFCIRYQPNRDRLTTIEYNKAIENMLSKFAELIIAESLNTIIKSYDGDINPLIAKQAIEEHFEITIK